jgi:hypothetical protein
VPTRLASVVNVLTARWLAAAGPRATAATGLGVWPLLALIAEPCEGRGRAELAAAIGIEPDGAMAEARTLLEFVDSGEAASLAAGVWTHSAIELKPAWVEQLPPGVRGRITGRPDVDARVLNAWAMEHTGGRIERFPLTTDPDLRLVLATALCVETTWIEPFKPDYLQVSAGPWAGADRPALHRVSPHLDHVRVLPTACGPCTDVTVRGDRGVDVHLVLGPEDADPAEVLSAGVSVIAAPEDEGTRGDVFTVKDPAPGPGVAVSRERSLQPEDELVLRTVPFLLEASHDLLQYAEVFGLQTVTDLRVNHFRGISDEKMGVSGARQDVLARFSTTGFEAAAVTAIGIAVCSVPPEPEHEVTRVSVTFDRPFAYYATDRHSGLIYVAGWVAEHPESDN